MPPSVRYIHYRLWYKADIPFSPMRSGYQNRQQKESHEMPKRNTKKSNMENEKSKISKKQ